MKHKVSAWLGAVVLLAPGLASATNGYLSHGYGVKAQGMAGVGIALPQDALAAATNPAGMALVGDRIDFGAVLFRPTRGAVAGGNELSGNGVRDFLIPEFGYNRALNDRSSLGVSVYANGGMNTEYAASPFGSGKGGVDLEQLFVAPTYAIRFAGKQAFGVSLNFAYQRFKAEGLQGFAGLSSQPNALTNNGYDSSTGWGVRIGWSGQLTPALTLGASWQSITKMGKFDKYAGLFAQQGAFDIPENYGIGLSYRLDDRTTLAADVQTIRYSGIPAVSNPMISSSPLGSDAGPGFGWRDMTVVKLAASHRYGSGLVVRAGYSHGRQPIPSTETQFNVLAPGIIEDHATLGATWALGEQSEVSVSYMHAFKNTVTGSGATAGFDLHMYEDSVGIAYGRKL